MLSINGVRWEVERATCSLVFRTAATFLSYTETFRSYAYLVVRFPLGIARLQPGPIEISADTRDHI